MVFISLGFMAYQPFEIELFICRLFDVKSIFIQTIQFSISMQFSSI